MINTDTPGTDPLSSSLHHGGACKAAASYFDPRRVSGLHDGVRYGRQLSPLQTGLPSGILRTEDAFVETVYGHSSIDRHTHGLKQILLPLGERMHAGRSIFGHTEPRRDNQDAYMVCSVLSAWLPPFRHEKRPSST